MSKNKKHLYYLHNYDLNNFKKKKRSFIVQLKIITKLVEIIYTYTHL